MTEKHLIWIAAYLWNVQSPTYEQMCREAMGTWQLRFEHNGGRY